MDEYTNNRNKHHFSNPVKRFFRVSDKTIVVIDEQIVNSLGIAEKDNTWVEQIVTDEGIMLKIRKLNAEVS